MAMQCGRKLYRGDLQNSKEFKEKWDKLPKGKMPVELLCLGNFYRVMAESGQTAVRMTGPLGYHGLNQRGSICSVYSWPD